MSGDSKVEALAKGVRASGVLGRSEPLRRLFDFLVARSADPLPPKEGEVAAEIMGAGPDFDASQNASVRVYVHRLRQKLDEYYDGPGAAEPERLALPKGGGYRLVAEARLPEPAAITLPVPGRPRRRTWIAAGLGLIAVNLLVWALVWPRPAPADPLAEVRANPIWRQILNDARPVTLVVGDYYIFGEMLGDTGENRLVRDYGINSPDDLDNYLMQHPSLMGRYINLDLFYLPVSIAGALKSLIPVLSANQASVDRLRVVQASDLTADMIKHSDVIYIGYLSGLGLLRDAVFSGSRFSVGATYDELIDNVSGHHYESQEGGPSSSQSEHRDFGYFSTFAGPEGGRILVIAGTRDVAVVQTAEALATPAGLAALAKGAHDASAFEALYEVRGLKRINLGGRLLTVAPLKTDKIWNSAPSGLRFPNG
jgi:hypothetical protein